MKFSVTIQIHSSISLTLHLAVVSHHMDFDQMLSFMQTGFVHLIKIRMALNRYNFLLDKISRYCVY